MNLDQDTQLMLTVGYEAKRLVDVSSKRLQKLSGSSQ
ncbi:hypothetical protein MMO42_00925 [Acinetobacter sp. ANC 3882]|nr:hypothetical protein [Acinetobacter sp. ANC 3882]MCH7312963.1 hypothetical protein [Acinetobacter sp. ANC 3882]